MSDLEKDFETVLDKIEVKLREAAAAIRAANKLAKTIGVDGVSGSQEGYPDDWSDDQIDQFSVITSSLFNALDEAGWSTSSMQC